MERLVLPVSADDVPAGPGGRRIRTLVAAGLGALAVAAPAALLPAQAVAGPEESITFVFGKATASSGGLEISGGLTINGEPLTVTIQIPRTSTRSG